MWAHWVIVGVYMQWDQYYDCSMVLNGPSMSSKICCLWSQLGPELPSELGVYDREWVHHSSWNEVPRGLNGPTLLQRNVAEIFELTHYCCKIILQTSINGPTGTPGRCCQCTHVGPLVLKKIYCWWSWIGPLFLMRDAANKLAWGHCYSWRIS